jgi:ribosome-associated protein
MKVLYGTDDGREMEDLDAFSDDGDQDADAWDMEEGLDGALAEDGGEGLYGEEERPFKSRSQKKREIKALESLGLQLAALGEGAWRKFRLSPELCRALEELGRIRSHGARCRHEKRIASLMREQEEGQLKAIVRFLEDREGRERREKGRMQYLESLRDRLAAGDSGLAATLAALPGMDPHHFLFLVDQAVKEKTQGHPKGSRRNLFRYLKDHLPEEKF